MLCIFTLYLSLLKLHASLFCLKSLSTILMYFYTKNMHYTASFTVTVFKNHFVLFVTFSASTGLFPFMSQLI